MINGSIHGMLINPIASSFSNLNLDILDNFGLEKTIFDCGPGV